MTAINQMQPLINALRELEALNSGNNRRKIMRKIAAFMSKLNKKRIKQNITPEGAAMQARKRKRKFSNRHGVEKTDFKMFQKMGRQLRQDYDDNQAKAFFNGAMGNTALDHQEGRRVKKGNMSFDEPMRELLGLPEADQREIANMIMTQLTNLQ